MMMRSPLYETDTLGWIFIVLAHWNNSPRIVMSPARTYYPHTEGWTRFERTTLVMVGTDWTCSCKSNCQAPWNIYSCTMKILIPSYIWYMNMLLNIKYISYINCTNSWNHKQLFSHVWCMRENSHIIVEGEYFCDWPKPRQVLNFHSHIPWSSSY